MNIHFQKPVAYFSIADPFETPEQSIFLKTGANVISESRSCGRI